MRFRKLMAALMVSAVAAAAPARFESRGHGLLSNANDPQDPTAQATSVLLHENTVSTGVSNYTLGVTFTNRFNPRLSASENAPFTLEKKSVVAEWDFVTVKFGDAYQELGRGIALALYRDLTFGLDTTLEGGHVKVTPRGFDLNVFAGRVNAWKNPVALQPMDSPILGREVFLGGLSTAVKVVEDLKVGGHYLLTVSRPEKAEAFEKRWQTFGATVAWDGILPGLDFYGESNLLVTEGLKDPKLAYPRGYGSYASLAWSVDAWRFKAEGKDYRQFQYDLRRPPNMEEDVVPTINTQDVSAVRVSSEYRFEDKRQSVDGAVMVGEDRTLLTPYYHTVGGTKFRLMERVPVEFRAGYRWAIMRSELAHALGRVKMPTFERQSIEFELKSILMTKNLQAAKQYEDRYTAYVTYNFSEKWNVGFGYEYMPSNPVDVNAHYFNGSASYKDGPLTAKAFGGQTSGGAQCSGGVCRQVPPYTGAYLEGTYAF